MRDLVVTTYREFTKDGGSRLAAALAYYILFALAPALVAAVALADAVLGLAAVDVVAKESLSLLLGPQLTNALIDLSTSRSATLPFDTVWIAVGVFFVTSVLALYQMQAAFNRMWHVDLRNGASISRIVRARLAQAVIALLPAAFLVLGTLASSLAVAAASKPVVGRFSAVVQTVGSPLVMLVSSAIAFTVIFEYLPDARVPWRFALISGSITALAWFVGTYLFGLYVGRTALASVYGAAGTVFVLLIWLNYSARAVLIGCKVSKLLTQRSAGEIVTRAYSTRVQVQEVELEGPREA